MLKVVLILLAVVVMMTVLFQLATHASKREKRRKLDHWYRAFGAHLHPPGSSMREQWLAWRTYNRRLSSSAFIERARAASHPPILTNPPRG